MRCTACRGRCGNRPFVARRVSEHHPTPSGGGEEDEAAPHHTGSERGAPEHSAATEDGEQPSELHAPSSRGASGRRVATGDRAVSWRGGTGDGAGSQVPGTPGAPRASNDRSEHPQLACHMPVPGGFSQVVFFATNSGRIGSLDCASGRRLLTCWNGQTGVPSCEAKDGNVRIV